MPFILNGYALLQGCRAILIDKDRKPKVGKLVSIYIIEIIIS